MKTPIQQTPQTSDPAQKPETKAKIHAIVVTYFPDVEHLLELLNSLHPQVAWIHVIDNTPGDSIAPALLQIPPMGRISIKRLETNRGIARALNIGIQTALENGADYVLLSDQDSLPDSNMATALLEEAERLQSEGVSIGCISPAYHDLYTDTPYRFQVSGRIFYSYIRPDIHTRAQEIIFAISSGSLIPRMTLEHVGLMDEDFFIDHVDSEWCHRAISQGYHNYGVARAKLLHRLGSGMMKVWIFGWHPHTAYSPIRLYFRFRNFILLSRLKHVPRLWLIRASRYWLISAYAEIVFSRNRVDNTRAIFLGLIDGIAGKTGPTTRHL